MQLSVGLKIRINRETGQWPVSGKITRIFENPYTGCLVEYRNFYSGGIYITKPDNCMPYVKRRHTPKEKV